MESFLNFKYTILSLGICHTVLMAGLLIPIVKRCKYCHFMVLLLLVLFSVQYGFDDGFIKTQNFYHVLDNKRYCLKIQLWLVIHYLLYDGLICNNWVQDYFILLGFSDVDRNLHTYVLVESHIFSVVMSDSRVHLAVWFLAYVRRVDVLLGPVAFAAQVWLSS